MRPVFRAFFCALLLSSFSQMAGAVTFKATVIEDSLGEFTSLYFTALNEAGVAVGRGVTTTGESRAVRWSATDGVLNLGVLPGGLGIAFAQDINDEGTIVGRSPGLGTASMRGFRWDESNATMTDIGDLSESVEQGIIARAINNNGDIAGQCTAECGPGSGAFVLLEGVDPFFLPAAPTARLQAGHFPNYFSDEGVVLGGFDAASGGLGAFIWDAINGTRVVDDLVDTGDPHYGNFTIDTAASINSSGLIPIRVRIGAETEAFVLDSTNGHLTDLGEINNHMFEDVRAINESGRVVGDTDSELIFLDPIEEAAFTWSPETGMQNLDTLLASEDPLSGLVHFVSADDINDRGEIIAQGFVGGELKSFLLTPVPVPAMVPVFALGVCSILVRYTRSARG